VRLRGNRKLNAAIAGGIELLGTQIQGATDLAAAPGIWQLATGQRSSDAHADGRGAMQTDEQDTKEYRG
jgi:hypothetical protein